MKKIIRKTIFKVFKVFGISTLIFLVSLFNGPSLVLADTVSDTYADATKINAGSSSGYQVTGGQLKLTSPTKSAWWTMNEASGTSLADSSGNGLTGTSRGPNVGFWKMDEASGQSVADSAGGNTGTATGTTVVAGKYVNARTLNGTSDYIEVPNSTALQVSASLSMETWLYRTGSPGTFQRIFSKSATGASPGYDYWMQLDSNYVLDCGIIKGDASSYYRLSTGTIAANTWTHVTCTFDSTNGWNLYINGALSNGTATGTIGAARTSTRTFEIARLADSSTWYYGYTGYIDDVRMYNYVRTSTEITADMNNTNDLIVAGQYSNARSFNGTTDYISVANNAALNPTTAFTVEAWVKLNSIPGASTNYEIAYKESYCTQGYRLFSFGFGNNGKFAFLVCGLSGSPNATAASPPSTGVWYHVAGTYDGSNVKLYVNGGTPVSVAATGSITNTTGNLTIGSTSGGEFMDGTIDDVRVYNTALNQAQITTDMNNGTNYNTAATVISTNLLTGITGVDSIDTFVYNLSSLPANTTATIQFSQNGTSWYNSSNVLSGTDSLTTGSNNTITIHALGWLGSNFYYKVAFTSDGSGTPVLDDVAVNYTTAGYTPAAGTGTDNYTDYSSINLSSSTKYNFLVDGNNLTLAPPGGILGNGTDGAITVSANKTIDVDEIASGRTVADGVNFPVTALGANTITVTPRITGNAPIGWWKLDEAANGTCAGAKDACDSSANGYHGTATGTTIISGKYGNARSFNGSTDYLDMGAPALIMNLTNAVTVEAWVKRGAAATAGHIAGTYGTIDQGYNLTFGVGDANNDKICFTIQGVANFCTTTTYPDTTSWHHVVATYNKANVIIYYDGTSVLNTAQTAAMLIANGSFRVGRRAGSGTAPFNGNIDDVRVYDYARSSAQVTQDINNYPFTLNGIAANDTILLINQQGDTTNNSNVGNYEFLTVQSVAGSIITTTTNLVKTYGVGNNSTLTGQKIVVQRVPNYTNVTINSGITLTATAWDGSAGGIVAFKANGTLTLTGTLSVNALGYRGGAGGAGAAGGQNGESFDGYNGAGGTNSSTDATAGGGRAGSQAGSPNNGVARGGGGGGGGGDNNSDVGAGGGGAGGGYAGGGGGGGGGGNVAGAGGAGGATGISGGGGGGGDNNSPSGAGGAAGSAGSSAFNGAAGGQVGNGATSASGGGGCGAAYCGGGGGGGGGIYGNSANSKLYFGSGGGGGGGDQGLGQTGTTGGAGGGIVFVAANDMTISGTTTSNGGNGAQSGNSAGSSGAGSGGSIYLRAMNSYSLSGSSTANGGTGGTKSTNNYGGGGGSGGAGRILVQNETTTAGSAPAASTTFPASATIISTNLLSSISNIQSIDSITYTLTSLPANTTATIQHSQDGSNWYNSSAVAGGTDSLSAGTNTISLSALKWTGSYFYYKLAYTSNGSATPILDSITVNYTTNTPSAGTSWSACKPFPGGDFTISQDCYFPNTRFSSPLTNVDGVDNGNLTINAYKTLTIRGDQIIARNNKDTNSGKGVLTLNTGSSIAINDLPVGAVGGNVRDYSGGDSEGQAVGSTVVAGKYGTARSFNGTSDYVDFGSFEGLSGNGGNITLDAWVYPTRNTGNNVFVAKGTDNSANSYLMNYSGGAFYLEVLVGSLQYINTAASYPINNWYHVAGIINGNNYSIYVNGVSAASGTFTGTLSTTTQSFWIGGQNRASYNYNYQGTVDDFRVYNYVRSPSQITEDMNYAPNPTGNSPVAWYRFEDGGEIKETNLWVKDVNGDGWYLGYGNSQRAQTNTPGTGWVRRNTTIGPLFGDGRDGNITFSANTNFSSVQSGTRTCTDAISYNLTGFGTTTITSAIYAGQTVSTATTATSLGAGCINAGDDVLVINLQGISTNNTNVGKYEFLKVYSASGTTVTFTTAKNNFYGNGATDDLNIGTATTNQRVIIQRIPQYNSFTVNTGVTLNVTGWDGTANGIIAFRANSVNVSGTISASALGYRGGSGGTHGGNNPGYGGESYDGLGALAGLRDALCGAVAGSRGGQGATTNNTACSSGTRGGGGGSGPNGGDWVTGNWYSGGGGGGGNGGGGGGGGGSGGSNSGGGSGGALGTSGGGGGGAACGQTGGATAGSGGNAGSAGTTGSTSCTSGYQPGLGGAAGASATATGAGAGSSNSTGGGGGGGSYGTAALSKIFFGSGGGGTGASLAGDAGGNGAGGGIGGGIIIIQANTLTVNLGASIQANGGAGGLHGSKGPQAAGNGAGGSILLSADTVSGGTNLITAPLSGQNDTQGGGGGAGVIAISANTITGTTNPTYNTNTAP